MHEARLKIAFIASQEPCKDGINLPSKNILAALGTNLLFVNITVYNR